MLLVAAVYAAMKVAVSATAIMRCVYSRVFSLHQYYSPLFLSFLFCNFLHGADWFVRLSIIIDETWGHISAALPVFVSAVRWKKSTVSIKRDSNNSAYKLRGRGFHRHQQTFHSSGTKETVTTIRQKIHFDNTQLNIDKRPTSFT